MALVIQGNSSAGSSHTKSINDRVEALRVALTWPKMGFGNVEVLADGRVYSLQEFAGTIVIGIKADGENKDTKCGSGVDLSRETDVLY